MEVKLFFSLINELLVEWMISFLKNDPSLLGLESLDKYSIPIEVLEPLCTVLLITKWDHTCTLVSTSL